MNTDEIIKYLMTLPYHQQIKAFLGMEEIANDVASKSYYEPDKKNDYLLARTFKAEFGIEGELSFLENKPGYIFVNPTTVISKRIPAKTISNQPQLSWTNQPSILFSIHPSQGSTIAHYGIGSLNSFSSTSAIKFLDRLRKTKNTPVPLTHSEKLSDVYSFLEKYWRWKIDDVNAEIEKDEKKKPSNENPNGDKRFYKPFELFLHHHSDYEELIFGLEDLVKLLNRSNKLYKLNGNIENILVQDEENRMVTLKSVVDKVFDAKNNPTDIVKMKQLIYRAADSLAKQNGDDVNVDDVKDKYDEYFNNGTRHNELLSRVYPWEITGIEWGVGEKNRELAAVSLMRMVKKRFKLEGQLRDKGIAHPLFTEFMLNKLALENPLSNYDKIKIIYDDMKKNKMDSLKEIHNNILVKIQNPLYIYQYSASQRELKNISNLVYDYLHMPNQLNAVDQKTAKEAMEIFVKAAEDYKFTNNNRISVEPKSSIKKLTVHIKTPEFEQWKKFWNLPNAEEYFTKVLVKFSADMINQPYVDDRWRVLAHNDQVVYRPNHDSMHSCRQLNTLNYLLEKLKLKNEKISTVIKSFTPEEIFCLKLGMFSYSAGRTNEKEGEKDTSNIDRSAAIFSIIANQLGFNPQLIKSVQSCIQENVKHDEFLNDKLVISGFTGDQLMQNLKTGVSKKLLDICHEVDLIRCPGRWAKHFNTEEKFQDAYKKNSAVKSIKFMTLDQINTLLGKDVSNIEMVDELLSLSKNSCELTGTPVHYKGFKDRLDNYDDHIGNNRPLVMSHIPDFKPDLQLKDIKINWTKDISGCLLALKNLRDALYPNLSEPSVELSTSATNKRANKAYHPLSWLSNKNPIDDSINFIPCNNLDDKDQSVNEKMDQTITVSV